MPLQKLGDRQVGLQVHQCAMQPIRMRRRLARRERAAAGAPSRTLHGRQRQPPLAHQRPRHRRLAMNELGAALGRISECLCRQRKNAAAAPVARFEHRHLLACARELARRHQAGRARADDQDMGWRSSSHRSPG
jgi:hypothetical protein